MYERNSHCSWCGTSFPPALPWPRSCTACGNRSYLNPLPVAVVLLPVGDGLVVVRRNIEPAKGTLTLPGGYMDSGETWQEAGRRELKEETGIGIATGDLSLYDVANGLDDTLVIFGLGVRQPLRVLQPFSSEETREVLLIDRPIELGFSMHSFIVERFFTENRAGKIDT